MAGADVVCQGLEGATLWDHERTFRMGLVGLALSGPISQLQQLMLERIFPGTTALTVAKKVCGSALTSPFIISSQFAFVGALKSTPWDENVAKIKRDVGPTWAAGFCFWPIVTTINFRYVPLASRAVVVGCAGALWNVYLCNQANKELEAPGVLAKETAMPRSTVVMATSSSRGALEL
jgi:hypothetical protein